MTAWIPFEDLRPGHTLVDMLDQGVATVLTTVRPIPELSDHEEGVGEVHVAFTDADGEPLGTAYLTDFLLAARVIQTSSK